MLDQAGRAAGFSRTCPSFNRRAALLQAGSHLGDRVAPDAADSASRAGIGVILHHGGQHGDVVALGSYHCALVDRHFPEAGFRGVRLLFWEESGVRGGFHEIPREQIDVYDT